MRDCLKNRAGFDRVLMAVAATFLTVSATSAFAQADPARNSAAELAIDAAIPRPEPANVPPPTINDFKLDTTASVPDTAKMDATEGRRDRRRRPNHADVVTAPAAEPNKADTAPRTRRPPRPRRQLRLPTTTTTVVAGGRHRCDRRRTRQRTGQGRQQCRAGGSAGRRQTARDAGREIAALFRPQGGTDRGREILHRARICAAVDARRRADRERQGRHCAAQGCRLRRLERRRLSGAGFCRGDQVPTRSRKPI